MRLRLFILCLGMAGLLGAATPPPRVPGQWLVVFKEEASRIGGKSDPRLLLHQSLGAHLSSRIEAIHTDVVDFPAGVSESALAEAYAQSPLVSAVEPNYIASKCSPNDPVYTSGYEPWYDQIRATQAFDAWTQGRISFQSQVTVAVVDTGCNANSDLGPQLLAGINYVSGESNNDLEGHGTFVAGIIAASTSNTAGMSGTFFDAAHVKILPVKVLNASGNGSDDQVANGVIYSADNGARVINLSLGQNVKSETLRQAVNYALKKGVAVVAAAGNDSGQPVFFPAAFPNVIAVSAVDATDQVTDYSNWGRVDLSAPGGTGINYWSCSSPSTNKQAIWSLCNAASGIRDGDGTSFSTPMVAAAAAMLLAQDPARATTDLYRILTQSADQTAYGPGYHPETGWGRLNVYKALTYSGGQNVTGYGSKIKAYNWPNPFNPEREGYTNLTFFLETAADTTLNVRDLSGDLVFQKKIDAGQAHSGMNIVAWDGKNGNGGKCSNGVYLLTVEAGGLIGNNRVMVFR